MKRYEHKQLILISVEIKLLYYNYDYYYLIHISNYNSIHTLLVRFSHKQLVNTTPYAPLSVTLTIYTAMPFLPDVTTKT